MQILAESGMNDRPREFSPSDRIHTGRGYWCQLSGRLLFAAKIRQFLEKDIDKVKAQMHITLNPAQFAIILRNFFWVLRVWIDDPENGIGNVKDAILMAVWNSFHANDIIIAFPQRDLHIKSAVPLIISET